VTALVYAGLRPSLPTTWLLPAGAVVAVCWRQLDGRVDRNHPPTAGSPSADPAGARAGAVAVDGSLGLPNAVTALRGLLVAWVAGFLVLDAGTLATPGWVSTAVDPLSRPLLWLPAVAYGTAALLDAADGALARSLGRETVLGAELDTEYDAIGLLVAAAVGVVGGAVPAAYLACGLARYAFVAGKRWRRRRGLAVHSLPHRRSRRRLAGLQMAYLAVALAPVTGVLAARVGALVLGGPFLLGFARDWLYVSGRLTPAEAAGP